MGLETKQFGVSDEFEMTQGIVSCAGAIWQETKGEFLTFTNDSPTIQGFFYGLREKLIEFDGEYYRDDWDKNSYSYTFSRSLNQDFNILCMDRQLLIVSQFYICTPKLLKKADSLTSEEADFYLVQGDKFIRALVCDDYGNLLKDKS